MDRLHILKMRGVNMKNNLQLIKIINSTTMVVLIILTDICNTQTRDLVKLIEDVGIIIILALSQIN